MANVMKGLNQFIGDIRNCHSKEQEVKRVNKEMGNIRQKFKGTKIDGYQKKKYVAKLMYMYVLGYDVDFGHMEAASLLTSNKYSEKSIGYLACALMLNEKSEITTLIINSILRDITGGGNPPRVTHQCLALTCVANIGGKDMAEALGPTIQRLLVSQKTSAFVKKKAALSLLRLYRKYPQLPTPDGWFNRLCALVDEADLGVVTSVLALIYGLVVMHGPGEFPELLTKLIKLISRIVVSKEFSQDYVYYQIPSPWVLVKCMKTIQLFPAPTGRASRQALSDSLSRLVGLSPTIKSTNHKNALHAVLFEAANVVVHVQYDEELIAKCTTLLGRFLQANETNIRYLGLEGMARLASYVDNTNLSKYQKTVLASLKDADISIRRQSIDLLFVMCYEDNVEVIVTELLKYLANADYAIREELVLKAAILAEKYGLSMDQKWYVDVFLQMISAAGDHVSDDVWYRVVHVVTNGNEDLQKYAAVRVYDAIQSGFAHETSVKVAAYILGEFGMLIAQDPSPDGDKTPAPNPLNQFNSLHSRFYSMGAGTKLLLVSAYVKFLSNYTNAPGYPDLKEDIIKVFERNSVSIDAELQQRCIEYLALAQAGGSVLANVVETMPPFPDRESILEKRLRSLNVDEDSAVKKEEEKAEEEEEDVEKVELSSRPAAGHARAGGVSTGDLLGDDMGIGSESSSGVGLGSTTAADAIELAGLDLGISTTTTAGGSGVAPLSPSNVDLLSAGSSGAMLGADMLGGGDDLLGMVGSGSTMNEEPNATETKAPDGLVDMLGDLAGTAVNVVGVGGDDDESNVNASPQKSVPSAFPGKKNIPEKVLALWRRLCLSSEGVLYEDEYVQIGVKSEMTKNVVKFIIFYGNKTAAPMHQFNVSIGRCDGIDVEMTSVPSAINPRTQVRQEITVTIHEEFEQSPSMDFSFVLGNSPHRIATMLPVSVVRFISPFPVSAQDFFRRWKAYGAENETQLIFPCSKAVNFPALNKLFSVGFHLAVMPGIDPNPNNIVCSGMFSMTGEAAQDESHQSNILLRLEVNTAANMMRMTFRLDKPEPVVSSVLNSMISQQLSTK